MRKCAQCIKFVTVIINFCLAVVLNGEGLDFGLDFEVGTDLQFGNTVKLHLEGLSFVSCFNNSQHQPELPPIP